jgi:hypothetical protein
MPLSFAPTKKGKFVLLTLYVMGIFCWMIVFVWMGFSFLEVDNILRMLTTKALAGLAEEFILSLLLPPVLILILFITRHRGLRQS